LPNWPSAGECTVEFGAVAATVRPWTGFSRTGEGEDGRAVEEVGPLLVAVVADEALLFSRRGDSWRRNADPPDGPEPVDAEEGGVVAGLAVAVLSFKSELPAPPLDPPTPLGVVLPTSVPNAPGPEPGASVVVCPRSRPGK